MDSLTQFVLGAAVGEQVLGKRIGNRAMLYGGLIATIPDLDIFIGKLYDPITALEVHRGFSHSIIFFLLASPLLGFLLARMERKSNVSVWAGIKMVFLCLLTHALLDAFTTWGTQLFWPLPDRVALTSIFVVDPLYTLPFIYCLIRVMWLPKAHSAREKWNLRGIYISSFYLLLTVGIKFTAGQIFKNSLATNNITYERLIVKPSPFNTILWNANVETPQGYWLGDYSFFDSSPITYNFYPNGKEHLAAIKDDEKVKQLIHISEGWFVITKRDGKLFFNDLRFGLLNNDPKHPEFAFSYELTIENGKVTARESENKTRREGLALLKRLMHRIGGK